MGEYATYHGEDIKIGTCEDMYYLRADQRHLVQPLAGSLDVNDASIQGEIRYRFPFPDEDKIEPGAFDNAFRHVAIHGVTVPAGIEHHSVQFRSDVGYLLSIPCPEGPDALPSIKVHKNGWRGDVLLSQQAYRGGHLAIICQCGGCGAKYWVPASDVDAILVACRSAADRKMRENQFAQTRSDIAKDGYTFNLDPAKEFWNIIADRISAGYLVEVPA